MDRLLRAPRLFVSSLLAAGAVVPLSSDQVHYLKNVLRRQQGDDIRVFNGQNGEWVATLGALGKSGGTITCGDQHRPQPPSPPRRHLLIPPLKKEPFDWLVEKAVELGMTDLHPIITDQADVRAINIERTTDHVVAATCQCERLDMPTLHLLRPLRDVVTTWPSDMPVLAALERSKSPPPPAPMNDAAIGFIVGPAGGWSAAEHEFLATHPIVTPVSLGPTILRAETAALGLLAFYHLQGEPA
jgi:16S rRNA (uracil1498-N3)-methyltransferase